jgi:hypothetical protein
MVKKKDMVMQIKHNGLTSLLDAANWAPSGDNTQPWWFVTDACGERIAFRLDETCDCSPMNAGQRMARIGIGAAIENLLRAAELGGWDATEEPATAPDLAVVRLRRQGQSVPPDALIAARVTNRRVYDRRPLSPEVLDRLRSDAPIFEGVSTHWLVGRDRIALLADLIGRADALMFGDRSMRLAFLSQVRFDAPAGQQVCEGLPLKALELSRAEAISLRIVSHAPDWVLKVAGAGRIFASKARQLVESSSGMCLIVAPDGADRTDLNVGRTGQRAWLALTEQGLAAQPMMSLLVLENLLERGAPTIAASVGRERITTLDLQFRELVPEIGGGRPAFLLRFGYAPPPRGRTGRREPKVAVAPVAPPLDRES